jgi:hypothetical protein
MELIDVSPPLATASMVFWDNRETTIKLVGSQPMASEECRLKKGVVLIKKNESRWFKIISSICISVISCVIACLPP